MTGHVRIPAGNLQRFCSSVLEKAGVPPRVAEISSLVLVRSDLRGISSHGVSRLGVYLQRIASGAMDSKGKVKELENYSSTSLLDAGNTLGQYAAFEGMNLCLEKAVQHGVGLVGMRNVNHIGMASFFSMMAVEKDMIGITMNNASPHVAPWGGKEPMLGTNPLSVAIPTGGEFPIVLDMATTLVSRGKVILAAKEKRQIPLGWAFDKEGRQTTDAEEALLGSLMPAGGHKGYGLSLCIDIISALMTGSSSGPDVAPMSPDGKQELNQGVFLQAIDIARFMALDDFKSRVQNLVEKIKGSALAEGAEEIFLPGEIEHHKEQEARLIGIPLEPQTLEELKKLGDRHQVDLEFEPVHNLNAVHSRIKALDTGAERGRFAKSKLERCAENLEKHGFKARVFATVDDTRIWAKEMIAESNTIGVGGSCTIRDLGLIEEFLNNEKTVYDHWQPGLTPEEDRQVRLHQGRCDCFFSSANAISETGEIVNMDGGGNRTNALTFGPDKIIIIAGRNKVTPDLATAIKRVQEVAAPMRAKSLGWDLPCANSQQCHDCNSPQRICRVTSILHRRPFHSDVTVALIDQDLGY